MNEAVELLRCGQIAAGMGRLYRVLETRRQELTPHAWRVFVESEVLTHPIRDLAHRDPATRRSFQKPRGYAGDAVLLDYIYKARMAWPAQAGDRLARGIFQFTTATPCAVAVRNRRDILARMLDQTAAASPGAQVVSVAAGHFREGEVSRAVAHGSVRVLAIDQDAESLAVIRGTYPLSIVTPVRATVRDIVAGRIDLPRSHLIYAAGLFDYLSDRLARRLASVLFDSLQPGGRLVVVNFLPGMPDRGYMEALAAWHLIYRSEDDLRGLLDEIPAAQVHHVSLDADESRAVAFCTVERSPARYAVPKRTAQQASVCGEL